MEGISGIRMGRAIIDLCYNFWKLLSRELRKMFCTLSRGEGRNNHLIIFKCWLESISLSDNNGFRSHKICEIEKIVKEKIDEDLTVQEILEGRFQLEYHF